MISRPSLVSRAARSAVRGTACQQAGQIRFLAWAAAPTTTPWQKVETAGVKAAARDTPGPTTKLALVAKAGTRYEPLPGLTTGLEEFAFKVRRQRVLCASCTYTIVLWNHAERELFGALEHDSPVGTQNYARVGTSRRPAQGFPHA